VGARYHGLLSPHLLGAKEHVTVGHFAASLAAERRAAPSVWHPGVSSSIFVVIILEKCEELPHAVKWDPSGNLSYFKYVFDHEGR
jgi:hypothetical protein